MEMKECNVCGKPYTSKKATSVTCSISCRQAWNGRKGGIAIINKYRGTGVVGYIKQHGVHQHRIVMEGVLGRPLMKMEIVHHKNGNKHDNRPDNLAVMTQAEHARIHSTKNRRCSIKGCDRKHLAKGLCMLHYERKKSADRLCSCTTKN